MRRALLIANRGAARFHAFREGDSSLALEPLLGTTGLLLIMGAFVIVAATLKPLFFGDDEFSEGSESSVSGKRHCQRAFRLLSFCAKPSVCAGFLERRLNPEAEQCNSEV